MSCLAFMKTLSYSCLPYFTNNYFKQVYLFNSKAMFPRNAGFFTSSTLYVAPWNQVFYHYCNFPLTTFLTESITVFMGSYLPWQYTIDLYFYLTTKSKAASLVFSHECSFFTAKFLHWNSKSQIQINICIEFLS